MNMWAKPDIIGEYVGMSVTLLCEDPCPKPQERNIFLHITSDDLVDLSPLHVICSNCGCEPKILAINWHKVGEQRDVGTIE